MDGLRGSRNRPSNAFNVENNAHEPFDQLTREIQALAERYVQPKLSPPDAMDNGATRCPVFCIADIPTTTLDLLLQCSEEYLITPPTYTADVSDGIVIINTKDITTITGGSSLPITSSPTAFLNHTLQEVRDWFEANVTQPNLEGFMPHCFLVLDDRSTEDNTCTFVCTQDSAPEQIQSLRCEFSVALENAVVCDMGQSIEEGSLGSFMRSGVTMTKEILKLAMHGGLFIEGGEVKLDQAWRDFGDQ